MCHFGAESEEHSMHVCHLSQTSLLSKSFPVDDRQCNYENHLKVAFITQNQKIEKIQVRGF